MISLVCGKSLVQAQGFCMPKFTRPFSSLEVGSGDETNVLTMSTHRITGGVAIVVHAAAG